MADTNLPEGTDSIVSDAAGAGIGADLGSTDTRVRADDTGLVTDEATDRPSGMRDAIKGSTEKLRSTATDKAYGFLGQGIERSSGALTNISALVGDTAANLDDRLGSQYGDYARSAAQTIEKAANSLAGKDPEELFEDARAIVRKSPGIALAGAAILGFALVRVVKSGLDTSSSSRKS
ncbi:MAG: hypothetical protein ABIQ98_00870 [Sphingomicrobium sp.]